MPSECLGCRTREDDLAACGRKLAAAEAREKGLREALIAIRDEFAYSDLDTDLIDAALAEGIVSNDA